jgi:hypothetical protein
MNAIHDPKWLQNYSVQVGEKKQDEQLVETEKTRVMLDLERFVWVTSGIAWRIFGNSGFWNVLTRANKFLPGAENVNIGYI